MAEKKSIRILVRAQKLEKKVPVNYLKELAKDLTVLQASEKVATLKKLKTKHFVVEDKTSKTKTVYNLSVSGKNYTTKTAKI